MRQVDSLRAWRSPIRYRRVGSVMRIDAILHAPFARALRCGDCGPELDRVLRLAAETGPEPASESPRAEYRRADADMGGAELDRDREVRAHAHRQTLEPVARGDLGSQREMRRRRVIDRRNA